MPSDLGELAGVLQVGRGAGCAALRYHIAGAAFTLATLGCHAKLELNFVKTHACTGMTSNFAVRNTVTNADDHGGTYWLSKINCVTSV